MVQRDPRSEVRFRPVWSGNAHLLGASFGCNGAETWYLPFFPAMCWGQTVSFDHPGINGTGILLFNQAHVGEVRDYVDGQCPRAFAS